VIERIRRASPVPWSYGVAYWPSRTDFDDAMARADADLYRRKDELRGDA
jgi:GGDEF domain-containing protein